MKKDLAKGLRQLEERVAALEAARDSQPSRSGSAVLPEEHRALDVQKLWREVAPDYAAEGPYQDYFEFDGYL